MEFFLRLDSNGINLVLKGLEILREGAASAHQEIVQQINAQAQSRSAPTNPPVTPGPVVTDSRASDAIDTLVATPAPTDTSSAPVA